MIRARTARQIVILLGLLALGGFLASRHLARPWVIAGSSMRPTLEPGDRVLVDPWSYRHREPRPGELVLLRGPGPGRALLIKRIAGIRDAAASDPGNVAGNTLGEGPGGPAYWVLGDNRADSLDSRDFGPVSRDRIQGRVFFRYWPPSRAGSIR